MYSRSIVKPRRLIVSPVVLHTQAEIDNKTVGQRRILLCSLYAALKHDSAITPTYGIRVLKITSAILADKAYWGGDGISVVISDQHTAAEFFNAINDPIASGRDKDDQPRFVIYEPETGQQIGRPDAVISAPVRPTAHILPFTRNPR